MDNFYLRIENDSFGFVVDGVHELKTTDIYITKEDYDKFFKLQSEGKQFRLKAKPTGRELFDYIEEFTPEVIVDTTPTTEERLEALEIVMLEMLGGE